MVSRLEEMPALVFTLICSNSSLQSLQGLSLASHACYEAAAPFLFRKLEMQISTRRKLREDVKKLQALPSSHRRQRLSHVRILKVWGRILHSEKCFDPAELAEDTSTSEEYDAEFGEVFVRDVPNGDPEIVEEAWMPLAKLIQNCSNLTDFVWVCWNQLPPCVLLAIHEYHPNCRLHLRTFRLRSLADAATDSHELDLIRSPCLYSISVKTVIRDSDGKVDHNGDAVLQVAAIAPNLRHINIVSPRTASSAALRRTPSTGQESWKGFVPPLKDRGQKGSLVSLSYFGRRGISERDIREWPKFIDMSNLRDLILGDVEDALIFRHLTQDINLPSLKLLDFGLSISSEERVDSIVSATESLIEKLNPLTTFRISGYLAPSVFDKLLQCHGPSLRRLTLTPGGSNSGSNNIKSPITTISSNEITKIEAHCAGLEYLSICIPGLGLCDQRNQTQGYVFSDICPKLGYLRELEISLDIMTSTSSMEESARRIWGLISEEKPGGSLDCLSVVSIQSTIALSLVERGKQDDVEVSIFTEEQMNEHAVMIRFHQSLKL